jgi:hypothetical protein
MADLLNELRESGIKKFNSDASGSASSKQLGVYRALETPTRGFVYASHKYTTDVKRFLRSGLVDELYVKTRRADSVLKIFRTSPKNIRDRPAAQRVANYLNLLIYTSGSRLDRLRLLIIKYEPVLASLHQQADAAAGGKHHRRFKTNTTALPPATAADTDDLRTVWHEQVERAEMRTLINDLTVFTHTLLLGIAYVDISDDEGNENVKGIISADAFFSLAQHFMTWTIKYLDSPTDSRLVTQTELLAQKDCVGFFSAILYAEDVLRLARKNKFVGLASNGGSSFFKAENLSGRAVANSHADGAEMGLVSVPVTEEPSQQPPHPRRLSFQQAVESIRHVQQLEGKTSSNLTGLNAALSESVTWLEKIAQGNEVQIIDARRLAWQLSQFSTGLKAEITASKASAAGNIALGRWGIARAQSDFGQTMDAIKSRELAAQKKAGGVGYTSTLDPDRVFVDSEFHASPAPWRVKGIRYLGPFGLLNVENLTLSTKVSADAMGSYTVEVKPGGPNAARMQIYAEKFGVLQGKMSKVGRITISRRDLNLHANVESYAWAYPLEGMTEAKVRDVFLSLKAQNLELSAIDYFMLNGGYVYYTKVSRLAPTKILSLFTGAPQLLFAEPRPLPAEWAANEDLFGDITLIELRELGARKFRWLTSKECKQLCGSLWKAQYHGGFAYLYDDSARNNFFLMLEPPKSELAGPEAMQPGAEEEEEEQLADLDVEA